MSAAAMDDFTPSLTPSASTILLPAISLIFFLLNLPSLTFHITHRNLAATILTAWILMLLLINFLNACIWPTDNIATWYHGEIYCDIQVKLLSASNLGTVGAVGVILRGLAKAIDANRLTSSNAEKRWKAKIGSMVDYGLCFGLPIYAGAVHYVVQPSRYYVFAISGCVVSYDDSWPSVVLVYIWPLIFALFAACYAALVIYRIYAYRRIFSNILAASSSRLNESRFRRLLAIALLFLIVFAPVNVYLLYISIVDFPLVPYSWKLVHDPYTFQEIFLVPSEGTAQLQNWMRIVSGILLWLCFGTGREARAVVRAWAKKCGIGKIWPWVVRDPKPRAGSGFGSRLGSWGESLQAGLRGKLGKRSSVSTTAPLNASVQVHSRNTSDGSIHAHLRNTTEVADHDIAEFDSITGRQERAHSGLTATTDASEKEFPISLGAERTRSRSWLGSEKEKDLESGMENQL